MKYLEADFIISVPTQDARDLLAALAGEAGFETFEDTDEGLRGYVQTTLFDEEELKSQIEDFPFEGVTVTYSIREAEDKDWNEQWEQEGFDPIGVDGRLVIHDGRHLPTGTPEIEVEIDARLAFGTGTHETTRMICSRLLAMELTGKRVLDCGCGTGILGITALKLGAAEAVGYDIDEWSADNARHNAVINQVDGRFLSVLGDATLLDHQIEGTFDLVLANINRNILLSDMPRFRQKMRPGAILILSGFYADDIPLLSQKAESLGLRITDTRTDNGWACVTLA